MVRLGLHYTLDARPFEAVFGMPRVGMPDATYEQIRFGCHELKRKKYFRTKQPKFIKSSFN